MDLQSLFKVLWKKRWVLIIVPFFVMCCAFLIRMFGDWQYRSRAELATGLTVSDELLENRLNPYEISVTFANLIEMIQSRAVVSLVSYKLMENDLKSPSPFTRVKSEELQEKLGISLDEYRERFLQVLNEKITTLSLLDPNDEEQKLLEKVIALHHYDYKTISLELIVDRIANSDFIEVSYLSHSPVLSAFVVNSLCDEFIRYYADAKSHRSNASLESLEAIVKQRKDHFEKKLSELKNFKSNNDLLNSGLESENKLRQIKEYESQVNDERQRIRGLEVMLANQEKRIQEAESGSASYYNRAIVDLRKEINEMNGRYIQGGQQDQTLLDSISEMRGKLDQTIRMANEAPKMKTEALNALKERHHETIVNLDIARENLTSLTNILNSIQYSIGDFASKDAVSNAMEKEVDVAREEYLVAERRLNDAKGKAATNRMSIEQKLMAEPAEKPESKKTMIFMLFSGFLSFFVCVAVIIGLELLDTSIKNANRLKKLTKFFVAGVLPQLPKEVGEPNWKFFLNHNGHSSYLQDLNNDLRKIRFEIERRKSQVVLITSLRPSQGKSFFVMALAYTLSLIRKRTLIIDTNLRHNTLTKMLVARTSLKQLMDHYKNTTKLLGEGEENTVENPKKSDSRNLITHTENDFVDIIGNKSSQLSPSEIIPEVDFQVLLNWLRNQYDYILLEGASLNGFSDSRELAGFIDLAVPIFSARSSISDADKESIAFLKSLKDKTGPAILNNVVREES